jgi:hypothetical protein
MYAAILDPFRGQVEAELALLGRYIRTSEQGLTLAEELQRKAIDEEVSEIKGEALEVMMRYFGHASSFQEELPMVMRYGHITAIYSATEHCLRSICKHLCEQNKSITVHISDLKRYPYIDASRTFLSKVIDARIYDWTPIENISEIRNCIVHCNGYIEEARNRTKVESLIQKIQGLEISHENRLLIEAFFIDESYLKIQQLFETIFTNLKFGRGFRFSSGHRRSSFIHDEKTNTVTIIGPESPLANRLALLEEIEPVQLKQLADPDLEDL